MCCLKIFRSLSFVADCACFEYVSGKPMVAKLIFTLAPLLSSQN